MSAEQFRIHGEMEATHWWFCARRAILAAVSRDLLANISNVSPLPRIVELGCSVGSNATLLTTECEYVGIDVADIAVEYARLLHPGHRFVRGSVGDSWVDRELAEADIVLLCDVLEHVVADRLLLAQTIERVRVGAKLLVTVPANPRLWSPHDVALGHHRRYCANKLKELWRGLPVSPLLLTHFNARLYPLIVAVRFVTRLCGQTFGKGGTDLAIPVGWVNRWLRRIFAGEETRILQALRGVRSTEYHSGASLMAVLRREAFSTSNDLPAGESEHRRDRAGIPEAGSNNTAQSSLHMRSSNNPPECVIVVPCFNEAKRLNGNAFREYLVRVTREQVRNVTFLFVNDASTDSTGDVLESLAQVPGDGFRVLHLSRNLGKAEAVRQGLLWGIQEQAEFVGYWDADLATPLEAIEEFRDILKRQPEVELVMGARVPLLGRHIARRRWRHYIGRVFATAASFALGVPVYDTQCGAKILRVTRHTRDLLSTRFRSRWVFDIELLARLLAVSRTTAVEPDVARGAAATSNIIYEVPLREWWDVPGSKLKIWDVFQAVIDLAMIASQRFRGKLFCGGGNEVMFASDTLRIAAEPDYCTEMTSGKRRAIRDVFQTQRELVVEPRLVSSESTRRSGFTLVELLVVIAIIGVIVALIFPAVQAAREAARRSQCAVQLKQIGHGLHSYHDVHKCLPINMGPWSSVATPPRQMNGKGWIVSILPQLEQQPLFDEFLPHFVGDFFSGGGIRSQFCRAQVQHQLRVLHCPSDGSVGGLHSSFFQWEGIDVAATSYKGVIGDTQVGAPNSIHFGSLPDCHKIGNCSGLFFRTTYREPQSLASVLDGTSNTMLVGEDIPSYNDHSAAFYSNGDWASCHARPNFFPHPPGPKDWPNAISFRSYHSNGVQFCVADGSVRFTSDEIDHAIYRALSTKAGGEPLIVP